MFILESSDSLPLIILVQRASRLSTTISIMVDSPDEEEWLVEGDLHLVLLLLCRFFMFVYLCDDDVLFQCDLFCGLHVISKTWILFVYDLSLRVEPTLLSFNPVACNMVTCDDVWSIDRLNDPLTLLDMVVHSLKYMENGKKEKVGFSGFLFLYALHFICSLVIGYII